MASRVTVLLIDDVSGEEAAETVRFALDGREYEIDLTDANASALRDAIEPWRSHARRTSGSRRRSAARDADGIGPMDRPHIQAYAEENGLPVPAAQGRIKSEVAQAWVEAGRPRYEFT